MKKITISILRIYKMFISPIFVGMFGNACRFNPTCSEYTLDSVRRYGVVKGLSLGAVRLSNCHA